VKSFLGKRYRRQGLSSAAVMHAPTYVHALQNLQTKENRFGCIVVTVILHLGIVRGLIKVALSMIGKKAVSKVWRE